MIKQEFTGQQVRIDRDYVSRCLPPRRQDSYKNLYGHLLVVAGSRGMMGAAVLATGGALRSGCGLVTVHVPESERMILQVTHPSAMVTTDRRQHFSEVVEDLTRFDAVVAGPGLGRDGETAQALGHLLEGGRPSVLDADALNLMAMHPELLAKIPSGSVLTPHAGELSRLLQASGAADACALAALTGAVVVVKGPGSQVCAPDGRVLVNTTGNPGMATAGSGDVLAGLAGGLLARGLEAVQAAACAVWLHGAAGDEAARRRGMESMNSSDLLDALHF